MTEQPPIRVNAPIGGRIAAIYVNEEQAVSIGERLILLENTARLEDVYALEEILTDSMQTVFHSLSLPNDLILGDLQNSYTQLRQKVKSYQYFRKRSRANALNLPFC